MIIYVPMVFPFLISISNIGYSISIYVIYTLSNIDIILESECRNENVDFRYEISRISRISGYKFEGYGYEMS